MRLFWQPLQIHFWQQVLKYHQRILGLEDKQLVSLVILDGFRFNDDIVELLAHDVFCISSLLQMACAGK